jgi:hypothetical protein
MLGVDWDVIRPLEGSQQKGFEELCAQLARLEILAGLPLTRVGTPDGGVECYVILNDGSELGWQAKYVNAIEDKQWSQIDKSIKTALEKHPRLIKYYICIPWDRPDARIDNRKSAQERWDEHVVKWTGWASERGMTVEFIYWGSSELIDRISRQEFISKYRFWFDARAFDTPWFTARLEEAVRAAGARYTPEIHVDLPIAAEFEAFGRTRHFFDTLKSHAREIRKVWNFFLSESKSIESSTEALCSALSSQVPAILSELGTIKDQPIGELPFRRISDRINSTKIIADELANLLFEKEQEFNAKSKQTPEGVKSGSQETNPFSSPRYRLVLLSSALTYALEDLDHGDLVAGNNLMILTGVAGTGKTHLLCDVARQRILRNQPTILLMGQRFISHDAPWTQASQQLDLPGMSAEDFTGALEAAAQVAGCRALVLVDAINEGAGKQIWPSNLASFLSHFQRSPWIGVALSVRSSYEDVIVPEEIRSHAIFVTHRGFSEHEYDAIRVFFAYYNLELPSIPLLAPEFRNPLFLKTLCWGLSQKGERRLPRGFHGITTVFALYLGAINDHLSSSLGFNKKDPLVQRALEALAKEMFKTDDRWLPRPKAEELINALLPGREFERSLYRGLVVEGILTEEIVKTDGTIDDEVVLVSYERFSDHLITKMLLDAHLNLEDPAAAFATDGPLSYLSDEKRYVSPGLLEALCIQVPERVGKELITLAPQILDTRWSIGNAFRQSIVWRIPDSCTTETRDVINIINQQDRQWQDTLDILLTVATVPDHPFNATLIDQNLRQNTMPERDAWWSIYLHDSWGKETVVDRFVEWASLTINSVKIDDESVDLYSIILAWMFTTSNRFLRDHATKALVNLLSGRIDAVIRLINRFSNIDDPYVVERVYAVAYGITMRSHDAIEVGKLAQSVYDLIFANGEPPAQILLRDYARGIVERAIFLESDIKIDPNHIRPPYKSTWPKIPTRKEIEPFLPDRDRGAWNGGDLWARNRIADSVLNDDFAFYVIGTNSSMESNHWLSLRLQDPMWFSPDERLSILVEDLSPDERTAWEIFQESDAKLQKVSWKNMRTRVVSVEEDLENSAEVEPVQSEESDHEILQMQQERETALSAFKNALNEEHSNIFEKIHDDLVTDKKNPPRFDLSHIQRYILWRVFDLGWTTEKFGQFDRFTIGFHGRDAQKAERIGKKYQWIAYHEIMAFVSDNFQYYESFNRDEIDHTYVGPWQIHMRDIDPSCIARSSPNKSHRNERSPVWWAPVMYDGWDAPPNPREWIQRDDNLPAVTNLLRVENPKNGSYWLNLYGIFTWNQPTPPDYSSTEVERREIWYTVTGFLIHKEDTHAFLEWAKSVDLLGHLIPQLSDQRIMLGEYGWAPAYQYYQSEYFGICGWAPPDRDCSIKLLIAASRYASGTNGFDCSTEENDTVRLPAIDIIKSLGLKWDGSRGDFVDSSGNLAALDPTEEPEDPACLLVREDLMREYLARENLTICWIINGEKRVYGAHFSVIHSPLRIMGAYILSGTIFDGFINFKLEKPSEN